MRLILLPFAASVFNGEAIRKKLRSANEEALRPAMNVSTSAVECTSRDQDPYSSGRHIPCCNDLSQELGQWSGSHWYYLCKGSASDDGANDGGAGCAGVWNNKACAGQFGNEECHTCGERIEWLKSQGTPDGLAKQRVAGEFFAQCGACAPEGGDTQLSTEGYELVWQDEFNQNGAVDSSKWAPVHSHGNGFGNNELQFYTNRQENAFVSDGTLKIRARRESYGGRRFTSAKLESRADWLYGKFHVRARLLQGTARGTWAANWMMPRVSSYGGWPRSGEIDIMEHVGYDTGKVHGTVHTQAYHHSIGTQIGGSMHVDVKDWHTYTVEWRPDLMLFACDDHVYQLFRKESDDVNKWPFNHKFYLILNMAVGGDWGGQRGIDDGAFNGDGQIMEVDWVRVEQHKASSLGEIGAEEESQRCPPGKVNEMHKKGAAWAKKKWCGTPCGRAAYLMEPEGCP